MHEHVVMINAGIYCSFYMHIVVEHSRTLIASLCMASAVFLIDLLPVHVVVEEVVCPVAAVAAVALVVVHPVQLMVVVFVIV